MTHLTALDPDKTTGKSKELFNAVQQKLGMVPNMMRTFGNSPAALNGYLSLNGALGAASVGPKLGELIALTVANINSCDYCNAAHSFIGEKLVHISNDEIAAAREGVSADAKIQVALNFVRLIVEKRGGVTLGEVNELKDAGYDEGAIAEIITHVGLNILTNYFNKAAAVAVDFPQVPLAMAAAI